jgi:hypothetical protein
MQPVNNANLWRVVVSRLELLSKIVEKYGFKDNGLSVEAVMTFTVSTFENPNGKVRKAAVNLIVEVYKHSGSVVRQYIKNQKPTLVQELKAKIMKIARKDRTKSAPIQRLANIVQPLDGGDDGVLPRPNTFPIAVHEPLLDEDTMSTKEKLRHWQQEKETHLAAMEKKDGFVVVAREKTKAEEEKPEPPPPAAKIPDVIPGPGVKLDTKQAPQRRGRLMFV